MVDHNKHLGNTIGHNSSSIQMQEAINEFNCKVNMVNAHFNHVNPDVLYNVFKTYCMPLYGSQLWDHSKHNIDKFYVAWRKKIRKIFGLPYQTHCALLPYICDDSRVENQLYSRIVTFCRALEKSKNMITNICFELAMYGSGSALCNNISIIANYMSISRWEICNLRNLDKHECNSETIVKASIIRDLLHMKHCNKYFVNGPPVLDNDQVDFMLNLVCTD